MAACLTARQAVRSRYVSGWLGGCPAQPGSLGTPALPAACSGTVLRALGLRHEQEAGEAVTKAAGRQGVRSAAAKV